ncbi:hypothetical protein [Microbacterium sp.]|uniref:hypothetical protein n=1 Tax=Microbacterium sp. TaxID=51671 RepID=UPI00260E6CFB|nr:hypothetical protein [Microbacterium sp.]
MAVVVDPDAGEERGEQLSLDRSAGGGEQCVGAAHEVEVAKHGAGALLERVRRRVQTGAHLMLLDLDVAEAALECVCSKRSVRGEIDEAFLLAVQLLEFFSEPGLLFLLPREDFLQCRRDFGLGFVDGLGGEAEESELASQGPLDLFGG